MNAKKVKKIRKLVYGDNSLRIQRQYVVAVWNRTTLMNAPRSLRAEYIMAKANAS